MHPNPPKAGRGQVLMVFGLILLPVVIGLFVVGNSMKGKEITPKWKKPELTSTNQSPEVVTPSQP